MKPPIRIPTIPALATSDPHRPFWSVKIPTFRARTDYLEKTLRSILDQAPDPETMEIEVVDDCSPQGSPEELARRLGAGRIQVHSNSTNLGLAGIWNMCVERAKGRWVHILHQDDVVLPGFYDALRRGIEQHPEVGAAFCRHAYIDEDGHWCGLGPIERREPGLMEGWLSRGGAPVDIQTPSIVVQRSVYEQLGGFLPELCYALDWEMWRRIAARFAFYYEPRIHACYRVHRSSVTSQLRKQASDIKDIRRAIDIVAGYLPADSDGHVIDRVKEHFALWALENGQRLIERSEYQAAFAQMRGALRCSSSLKVLVRLAKYGLMNCAGALKRPLSRQQEESSKEDAKRA